MLDDLVVISANGDRYIDRCLKSLGNKYPILVVNTGKDPIPHEGTITPYQGYTTGAYLWAYWKYPAKNYFFMQDSMEALTETYLDYFKMFQPERGCAAWAKFPIGFDSDGQRKWAEWLYGSDLPEYGIFGPVFYVNRASLDELSDKKLLPSIPFNKDQAQGTERLWAMAFKKAGMEVNGETWSYNIPIMNVGMGPFRKDFADRK